VSDGGAGSATGGCVDGGGVCAMSCTLNSTMKATESPRMRRVYKLWARNGGDRTGNGARDSRA
jgi:hypothetical protein